MPKRNEFGFMCVIPAGDYCLYALLFTGVHGGDVWESSGSAGHDGVPGSLWGSHRDRMAYTSDKNLTEGR